MAKNALINFLPQNAFSNNRSSGDTQALMYWFPSMSSEYNPTNESWIDRSEKLETGRRYALAIPLPDDPNICN